MREIKFRAWDNRENRWMTADEIMERVLVNPSWDGKQFQIDEKSANGLARDIGYSFELMQFTGLKDKNGKEIYEEDVARNKYGSIGIIKFHETWCAFYFSTVFGHNEDGQFVPMISSVPMWNEWNTLEVIGNIYENPDLLKEDKP